LSLETDSVWLQKVEISCFWHGRAWLDGVKQDMRSIACPRLCKDFKEMYGNKCTTHTHTHTTIWWPFSILSGTTRVCRHQKGKTRKVKPVWIYWSKREWVAVASAGPYANLHLDPDITTPAPHYSYFAGWMLFMLPNQQRQITEGNSTVPVKWPQKWFMCNTDIWWRLTSSLDITENQFLRAVHHICLRVMLANVHWPIWFWSVIWLKRSNTELSGYFFCYFTCLF